MNYAERRVADRRAAALAGWMQLGRVAERRKADRNRTLSAAQAAWHARYTAARYGDSAPGCYKGKPGSVPGN